MQLYDALSLDKSLPKRQWLDREETLAAEPALDEWLEGAWRFYDAQVPLVERLVIENVVDAAAHGAHVLNHARAIAYLREGDRVGGAVVRDRIAETDLEVRARLTVNATGPWLDLTIAPLRNAAKPLLRLTKGIHLVTPRAIKQAHVLFAKSDGRLFFVLPWLDATIVGTTDTDYEGDPADAAATEEDVRYLQEAARRAFPGAPFDEIDYTWAGVRALVREEGVSEGDVSRKHALFDHDRRDGVAGVLSVVGGKLTAYRAIAEEVTDLAARRLAHQKTPIDRSRQATSPTADKLLPGADGSRSRAIAALAASDASLAEPLCLHQQGIAAEIAHAVNREWAITIGDVLLRRTALGLAPCQGLDCLDAVADLMGRAARLGRRASEERDRGVLSRDRAHASLQREMSAVLALDQGTTGSAALVFDVAGTVRGSADREIARSYPASGHVEHDPDEIFATTVAVGREALAAAGLGARDVAAIGITNQRETTVVWERDTGKPIHPAVVWQSRASAKICESLRARGLEPLVRERTGLVIDAYFSATKVRWILDQVTGAQTRAAAGDLLCGNDRHLAGVEADRWSSARDRRLQRLSHDGLRHPSAAVGRRAPGRARPTPRDVRDARAFEGRRG